MNIRPLPTLIYLDARPLADVDEEYRAANQAFRQWVLNTVVRQPNHPLKFLVNPKTGRAWRSSRSAPRAVTYDAGHVIPVANLAKQNWTRERLVVQDRALNRSNKIKRITRNDIFDVAGVPVDRTSLTAWSKRHPQLVKYVRASPKTGGWDAAVRGIVKELEFVWTTDGPFVHRAA